MFNMLYKLPMWTAILGIIGSLISWLTKKDERDVSHDQGRDQGIAEQKSSGQSSVIKDMTDAKAASNSVDASVSSGVPVTDSDGFRRD